MARLQTFPDNFFFEGTMKRGMWQVGNAVPVKLSEHLGLAIKSLL
jgi:DNA (cytosine-5)-methyltransferase 1